MRLKLGKKLRLKKKRMKKSFIGYLMQADKNSLLKRIILCKLSKMIKLLLTDPPMEKDSKTQEI